jgi:hypothetical protein
MKVTVKSSKGSIRTRRIFFSGRGYYQSIEHFRKYPETKFHVLHPTGACPTGLPKIENWPKMVLYMGFWENWNPNGQRFSIQNLLEIISRP